MLAGSLSFAIMAALTREASHYWPWQVVALMRAAQVAVLVGAIAVARGVKLVLLRPGVLWMRSLAGSCSLVATFYALTQPHVPVSTVLTLTNTFPLWVAILSWPMLGTVPAPRVWIAIGIGVVGVGLIEQPEGDGPRLVLAAALFASLATSVSMLGLHKLRGVHPMAVVVHFAVVAIVFTVAAFFVFPFEPGSWPTWSGPAIPVLVGVGVSASVGQLFLTKAFAGGDPAKVSIVGLSQVLFALAFDLTTLSFGWRAFAGIALIIAPTAWVMRRRSG
jgi:drug/metabolite transporter (DMT)-like permease